MSCHHRNEFSESFTHTWYLSFDKNKQILSHHKVVIKKIKFDARNLYENVQK